MATNSTDFPLIVYKYDFDETPAMVGGILFIVLAVLTAARLIRRKTWWALALPIGLADYAIALFLRKQVAANPTVFQEFLFEEMLIFGCPGAMLAFFYGLYTRLFTVNRTVQSQISCGFWNPKKLCYIFMASDGVFFSMQVAGSVLQLFKLGTGRIVLIFGLVFQFVFFVAFAVVVAYSHYRVRSIGGQTIFPWTILWMLEYSCAFVLFRGLFRIIVRAQGGQFGFLWTHEAYFYVSDTLPLFFAALPYFVLWPGDILSRMAREATSEAETSDTNLNVIILEDTAGSMSSFPSKSNKDNNTFKGTQIA